jgi:phosphatidate cytidylyltransferase
MTPRLSPGKTWEGTIGGVLLTLACGWTVYRITGTYSLTIWLVVSVMISVLGLIGDLFESGLKRKKRVKDMGSLLPGHGGIMDRFDSLLLVAPALLLLYVIINLFT